MVMDYRRYFQAWLRLACCLDWSAEQRDATSVRAFATLQLAMRKWGCSEHDEGENCGAGPNRTKWLRISTEYFGTVELWIARLDARLRGCGE